MHQAVGPKDHTTTPTFLHLYKIPFVYSVLKPPTYGNCTITDNDLSEVSLTDLREIFHYYRK